MDTHNTKIMKRETVIINDKEYTILIGQNANENDQIIKMSNQNDIWFHFENISGPHIVLCSDGDTIPKRYLNEVACKLFLYKQKAPKNQNVIYTQIKNVKLTDIPGLVKTKNLNVIKF
jgi:predicted ribosome quality control (RQC) complex YloA/Tae2 family protein